MKEKILIWMVEQIMGNISPSKVFGNHEGRILAFYKPLNPKQVHLSLAIEARGIIY